MKKFFVLALASIVVSCSTGQDKSVRDYILKDLNTKYDNAKDFFGKDMVNYLPVKLDTLNITFTESFTPDVGNLELMVISRVHQSQLASIVDDYKGKAICSYAAGDSCLLIVNRFATRDNYYKVKPSEEELPLVDRECYLNKLPVPNFWHNDFTTEATDCQLPRDFRLYVIESKAGEYFDKEYLTHGESMPANWKNGYSKGVAISEERQVIIYWLIIW